MLVASTARAVRHASAAALIACGMLLAGCGGGNVGTASIATPVPGPAAVPATFASIGGAPATLSTARSSVTVPSVPGVPTAGGSISLTATTPVTAVVTIASVTGASGGPPVALQSTLRRAAEDFNGTTVSPQYYVGITNTTSTAAQINVANLTLGVNVPANAAAGLALYDPSLPQNAWNQNFAFGSQVATSGTSTTFAPNATLTIYPGATLWLAPYTYPIGAPAPTPAPSAGAITPAPAPAPASITGTYVGTAVENGVTSSLTFTLAQSGGTLSGNFALLPSGPTNSGSYGTLTGSVSGGRITLTGVDQYGDACRTAIAATISGSLISGTYVSQPPCAGTGTFSATLQSASLPIISGTYTGSINDSQSGAGTLTLTVTSSGTVFSGTGSPVFPARRAAPESDAIVGFVTTATTASFAVISTSGGNASGGGSNCSPFGTMTIAGNTLNGAFTNSGGGSGGACSATGTFSIGR